MRVAGITTAYIVLREGKWDIPTYLGDGSMLGMHFAYLMMDAPFGVPYTLDQAYPFVQDTVVAFGFADILFQSEDAFSRLLARKSASEADAVLGLFPADRPEKVDMVEIDDKNYVRQILIRPRQTLLKYTWGIAVWTPAFTHFLHSHLATHKALATTMPELSVGDIFRVAIHEGLHIEAIHVSNSPYLDIGTPEDLVEAARRFSAPIT
ncbi:MAG: hypothetical protein AUI36_40095 [Cyanobacteria bacterium 13_1_40CM_2_61_4]|nr:MAG: hypothetical protein AUI36_40095 [Cyanobacteria bacterium 13_1_40CM_2_61_4]